MPYDYDILVIGGGPAGEKGACQAAYFGKRAALVEKGAHPGGACVHTGTLPSKSLRESALALSAWEQRAVPGLSRSSTAGISVAEFMVRKEEVAHAELERIDDNLRRHGVERLRGEARFEDAHTVRVGDRPIAADKILIAVGSVPHHPPAIPFDHPLVDDSDTILEMDRIPARLLIVGGGVIGCEYASIFGALGVRVTLVDTGPHLLPFVDREIGHLLETALCHRLCVELCLQEGLGTLEPSPTSVRGTLRSGRPFEVDRVLASVGRSGATAGLGLERVGLRADARGLLTVNEHFQTAVPNIYAAGDVIGFPALAATSMEQARVAMTHACGGTYKTHVSSFLPFGIYTIPEVSMVGETEESAQQKGTNYEVGRALYCKNARAQIQGELEGLVKLVFSVPERRLLGVHLIGERATELVAIGQAALMLGAPIDHFIETVFNYPTLSELYKYAAYDGLGRLARRNS